MEMESLHPSDLTETAEVGLSSQPSTYKDAQVWKDLEAETGFAACADYLEYYKDIRPDFEDRLEQLRRLPEDLVTAEKNMIPPEDMTGLTELPTASRTSLVIYDLSKQENHPFTLSLRCHCHSGTELIQALREPPGNVCVQLVLWSFKSESLNQEMADALILGLKLDPQLLRDFGEVTHKYYLPRPKTFRTTQIKSLVGNGTIATLSQNFMPEVANTVPVLLVASSTFTFDRQGLFERILAGGDQGKPPFQRSAHGENNSSGGTARDDQEKRGQLYAEAVKKFIMQSQFAASSKIFPILAAASPLLYIEAYRVRKASNGVRSTYDTLTRHKIQVFDDPDMEYRNMDKDLGRQRLRLRRTLEEAEDHVNQFFRYLGCKVDSDWSKEASYLSIQADWKSLIGEARRLEAEVRDYMQLQVGNLSLEESRRSIELSNIQIRESKSGMFETRSL